MLKSKSQLGIVLFCRFYFLLLSGFTVVGHRGDPINAPEETFQSIDMAFSQGANYVELDLHESQDGILVISHDRNLKRVTGVDTIVSQNTFAKLSTLKMSNGEPVHSVEQLFQHYQNNPNAKFLIETKKTKKGNPRGHGSQISCAHSKVSPAKADHGPFLLVTKFNQYAKTNA
ncbi:glycerophosphodiester phosphodiesterase family protein [Latilactobacillus sakei]